MPEIELTTSQNNASVNVIAGDRLKKGDTLPAFQCRLLDNGAGYDLTDKQPMLHMKGRDADSKRLDGAEMNVLDENNGEVEYQWESTDTSKAGTFDLEVVVVSKNGKERTFPLKDFISVQIFEDLQ